MSTGQSSFRAGRDYRLGGSRHTNLDNSVTPAEGGNSAVSDHRELPHPADRAAEFIEEYPDRADLPLTRQNGRSIRAELLDREYETHYVEAQEPTEDGHLVTEQVYANPCTWGEAVYRLLADHDETRDTTIHLERGRPDDPEYATHDIPATNRWMHDYQKRYYAELKAWMRELRGGERPSGNVTPASFDDPHIVLMTRGASSVPDGDRLAPIDHADSIRESWTDCYHTLRNRLRANGYDLGDDWQYDRRLEPHTGERGGGTNWCYPHEHAVIVVDGEISPSEFRPVVEKHVESCEYAGEAAHDLDIEDWDQNRDDVTTVTVKPADEVENLAQYVASYTGIKPVDLLERSTEYIGFAAIYWASFSKTITRSDAARHAATADACRQRYESGQSDQEHDHGEEIRREEIRGKPVLVCAECGSPHDIDQDQTLSAARLDDSSPTVVADGGLDREQELRERWPSARAAARVGEAPSKARDRERIERYIEQNSNASPPEILGALELPEHRLDLVDEVLHDLDRSEVVRFERPPEWRVDSITVDEETHQVTDPDGIDLAPTDLGDEQLVNWIMGNTVLGTDAANRTLWRVPSSKGGFNTWGPDALAHALADRGFRDPATLNAVIKPVDSLLTR